MTESTLHRICVAGASGRMGRMLIEAICSSDDCQLSGALDVATSPAVGMDPAAAYGLSSGIAISADLHTGLSHAQALIDFTRPEGTMAHLQVCRELGVNAVIGTTGFSERTKARDCRAGQRHCHRHGAQHECGRQRHAQIAGNGGQSPQ